MNFGNHNNESSNNNESNTSASLQLLLEFQRQQQLLQQHQLLNQLQQQRQLQNAQQQAAVPGLQALLIQQSQQQQNLASGLHGLNTGLVEQPSSDLEAFLRQSRREALANQLLLHQQNFEDRLSLAAAARPQTQQQPTAIPAATPLSSLFASQNGEALQRTLLQTAVSQASNETSRLATRSSDFVAAPVHSHDPNGSDDSSEEKGDIRGDKSSASAKADDSESGAGGEDGMEDEEDHPANDTFPFKLHRMLEHAEKNGLDDVISFRPDGKSFAIHKPRDFVSGIMPKYFTTSRMSSFQRQLNLYGFRRISEGQDKGAYYHKYFLKGRRVLCKKIKRKKTSTKATVLFETQSQNNTLSIRQLLAERQFGSQHGLGAAAAGLGFNPLAPQQLSLPMVDPNQALANLQMVQRLELLMLQKEEENRLQQEQQQAQGLMFRGFPPGGTGGKK